MPLSPPDNAMLTPLAPRPTAAPPLEVAAPAVDVTVCIANWNCRDYLRRCLESIHRWPQGVSVETVVVDNASADGAAEMVAREFPEVVLIRNDANRGFARASNQAAEVARGRYLFFLNNDTELPALTLRRLMEYAETDPGAGLIGPALRGADGEWQVSYRRKPTVSALLHRTALFRWTGLFRAGYRHYRRDSYEPGPGGARSVEVLMGAAVLVPRPLFEACGGWDEVFDFGGEDIDLSVRVGRTHRVVYLPDVQILHHGRVSSRQNITFAAPNVIIGYVHCLRKSGVSGAAIVLYKLAVTLDGPLTVMGKFAQWAWRRLRGRRAKADRSWLAVRAAWRLTTGDLGRLWRA
jgi:N-acetylglucosaminyl-diphospho-decaprenol L-rhamnosyltransferase